MTFPKVGVRGQMWPTHGCCGHSLQKIVALLNMYWLQKLLYINLVTLCKRTLVFNFYTRCSFVPTTTCIDQLHTMHAKPCVHMCVCACCVYVWCKCTCCVVYVHVCSVCGVSICVYVYMCVCVHVCMCTCMYVYMYVCVHVCMCTYPLHSNQP